MLESAMRVAAALGRLDEWESLTERLTPHDFEVLRVFLKRNPIGERRADLRHAHLVSIVANLVRSKDDAAIDPDDALAHFLSTLKGKRKPRAIGPAAAAAMVGKALG